MGTLYDIFVLAFFLLLLSELTTTYYSFTDFFFFSFSMEFVIFFEIPGFLLLIKLNSISAIHLIWLTDLSLNIWINLLASSKE